MIRTLPRRRPVLGPSSLLVLILLAVRVLRLVVRMAAAGATTGPMSVPVVPSGSLPRAPDALSHARPTPRAAQPIYQAARSHPAAMPRPRGRRMLAAFAVLVGVGLVGTSLARASVGSRPTGAATAPPAAVAMSLPVRERPTPVVRSLVMEAAPVAVPAGAETGLLPATALPACMEIAASAELDNARVAALFPGQGADPARTAQELVGAGRTGGAMAAYRAVPGAAAVVTALSTSVAQYQDAAAARVALADPAIVGVLPALGLRMQELATAPGGAQAGEESRLFGGTRTGDGPGLTTYLVMFRQGDAVGAVSVTLPAADDGGRLAMTYAQLQATHTSLLAASRP